MELNNVFRDVYSYQIQQSMDREFVRLKDHCYLDHTGSTLYALSQIQAVMHDLSENVYGNPHSLSVSSRYTSDIIDQARYQVLKHFNTDPNEYDVIFTHGATDALKLVSRCFDWTGEKSKIQNISNANGNELAQEESNVMCNEESEEENKNYNGSPGTFAYLQDNHTSVLGMREEAAKNGAHIECISHIDAFTHLSGNTLRHDRTSDVQGLRGNSLFVYPAQCNFSGVKYPLAWISNVHNGVFDHLENDNKIFTRSKWFCMLDAATFVATNSLDLRNFKPDFVCLSFYKIFGYPTGLGALLVKNTSSHVLHKIYFGGGTVLISLSSEPFHIPRPILHDMFEDGTISFLSIISLQHGFKTLYRLTHNMTSVATHTFSLARYIHHHLVTLQHGNGKPVAIIYADTDYENIEMQGNIVNFNLLRPDGNYIGFMEVLNMANLHNIHLRTGCFCNPGACQRHLQLSNDDLRSHFQAGHVCGDDKDLIEGRPTGSVRISFGYMSKKSDADTFVNMIHTCFVEGKPTLRIPDWWNSFTEEYRSKFKLQMNCDTEKPDCEKESISLRSVTPVKAPESMIDHHLKSSVLSKSLKPSGELPGINPMFLSHIYLYPVKSCGAFSVSCWMIGCRGLKFDREWMVVAPSGVCLSQKQDSRLCLVTPTIDLDQQVLQLDFPGMSSICVPLSEQKYEDQPDAQGSLCQSKVCGDRIQGWDCGDDVALWLSEALMRDGLRLIRQWNSDQRSTKHKSNTEACGERKNLSLSNQAQFLLLNMGSIAGLAERLSKGTNLSTQNLMQRFRCNLVIEGAESFSENKWSKVSIGQNHFQSEGPCTRCQMVCIDQATGDKTREPLKTLAEMFHGKMRFGVYFSHIGHKDKETEIKTGDLVFPNTDCD